MKDKILKAQNYLKEKNIDAWVIYDYECTNSALISFIGKRFLTRKSFTVINKERSFIIAHKIDEIFLNDKEISTYFDLCLYQTWDELMNLIKTLIADKYTSIIMEYSELGALPRSSYCDYGTVKMFIDLGLKVNSSVDLLISYISTYEGKSLESQKRAMKITNDAKDKAFKYIEDNLKKNNVITEYDVVKVITNHFKENGLVYDSNPIVAVNGNAGNPHYEPKETQSSQIKKGDLILIDLWAKEDVDYGVYADITWMGYAGKKPPEKYIHLFNILKESIDNGLNFLNENLPIREVMGYEVDEVVRNTLKKYNQDQYLVHRVGHSIDIDNTPHGKGVNIDNYETHDTRHILNHVGFSIEPGIYTSEYGFREEIDVYIENKRAISIAPRQNELILLDVD